MRSCCVAQVRFRFPEIPLKSEEILQIGPQKRFNAIRKKPQVMDDWKFVTKEQI
jgi:hypothetical protein